MTTTDIPPCGCPACQQPDDHPDRELHRQMILVFSRLDEQQRRWLAALESNRIGRGREELTASLAERSVDRIRLPGGGRPDDAAKVDAAQFAPDQCPAGATGPRDQSPHRRAPADRNGLCVAGQCQETGGGGRTPGPRRAVPAHRAATGARHKGRAADHQRGHEEEGTDRELQERRAQVESGAGGGQCPRLLVGGAGACGPLRDLRGGTQSRHGRRRQIGRHAGVRGRGHWALVGHGRRAHVSGGERDPDLGRRRGSNGCRPRLWKQQLQEQLCDQRGLAVTVCHYPTGCSKWNPIAHRLFGPISVNWAGKPLRTGETLLAYVRGTTTTTGLDVSAVLVDQTYDVGRTVSDATMHTLNLEHHAVCPTWNYTLRPRTTDGHDQKAPSVIREVVV